MNAYLGHYPFRCLRHRTAAEMILLMDRNGIDRAVVSSLHAVFYRDAHRGNEELRVETRPHGERFIPAATVNPKYAGWEHDLAEAVERWKMKVVTLTPDYHGYTLGDEYGRAALGRIADYGVPLLLTQRFEDRRQRHAFDRAEDLQFDALFEAARAFPKLRFILVNWLHLDGTRMVEAGLKGRCLVDFARMQVIYRKDVPKLIDTLGVAALTFGSHMPFDYVGGSLVKLANFEKFRPAEYEAIAWRNAAQFLSL
ncbi:MAG: amidohydrolase family protein [Acidobacteria bacterium]|nr:amidohydrolase family protein [Acidobacteriota bacterium]MCI0719060.1 amidohydrolase family protein [Acidobacteriota bacterium]